MKKPHLIVCLLMVAIACAATAYYWPLLPEVVPVHWNAAGVANGYGPRASYWAIGPGMMLLAMAACWVTPWLSPRRYAVDSFAATYSYIGTVVVAMMGYIYALVLTEAVHGGVAIGRAVPAGMAVLLILIGNPMGKVRRNFFLGIRTPWTLGSEAVWYGTHRMAARLMVGSGLLTLFALWLGASPWLVLALILAWAPLAVGYSLLLYKRLPH
ncbi:SdpI family protein [Duganella sp. sic0402]|uniref:SdpI family protein n=1 Tax=Duganella sp. sic0402 TaxID=2854786 RepID=UPI001C444EDC|nr:SdpI family protein [Duganella sp. sic0402]MBV7535551.1 SdpI family protein [Duganella sp. sic0402]